MKAFFKRLFSRSTQALPEGWTYDCSVHLVPGKTLDELVDFIFADHTNKVPTEETLRELAAHFLVHPEEAELAMDRAFGGIVRAETENPANCPDPHDDPIAWTSYQKAIRDPGLIAAIRQPLPTPNDGNARS
jgi:hypothetical protein